jgi:hypothetical protein
VVDGAIKTEGAKTPSAPRHQYKCPDCDKVGPYEAIMWHCIWDHGLGFRTLDEVKAPKKRKEVAIA